jgi:hypothetical protein
MIRYACYILLNDLYNKLHIGKLRLRLYLLKLALYTK